MSKRPAVVSIAPASSGVNQPDFGRIVACRQCRGIVDSNNEVVDHVDGVVPRRQSDRAGLADDDADQSGLLSQLANGRRFRRLLRLDAATGQ